MVNIADRLERPGAVLALGDSGGDGPALLLLHGAGLDHTMYEVLAEALVDAGYRVILGDLRGHGRSTLAPGHRFMAASALDDIRAVLDARGVDRAALVGHSLGGNLAQAFARTHAARVAGLVVLDSTWNAGPLSPAARFALRLAAPSLAVVPTRSLPGLMARASAESASAVARAEATFAAMPKPTFIDVWRATVSLVDPVPGYRSPVPLALIRGERDRTGNIASAMPRWAEAEGIAEQVIPGAGHIVTWDAPEATTQALLRALRDLGVRGGRRTP